MHLVSKINSLVINQPLINNQYLAKFLTSKGFTFQTSKNKEFEIGFSMESFTIQKGGKSLNCFVLKLDKQLFVCAGYRNGKLIQQKEIKFETDLPHTFVAMFDNAKIKSEENIFRFDVELEKVRGACQKIQKVTKNYNDFNQEVKSAEEYINIKNLQKLAFEKMLQDSKTITKQKSQLLNKNKQLIDALLAIEDKKQLFQTSLHSFDSENQFISNIDQRIDQQINLVKANSDDLNPSNINEVTFKSYLKGLIQIKQLQIKKKCLEG